MGDALGDAELGFCDGLRLGLPVDPTNGTQLGTTVGKMLGITLGDNELTVDADGTTLGNREGAVVGILLGAALGQAPGDGPGLALGDALLGLLLGENDTVGALDTVGLIVGYEMAGDD